MLGHIDFPFFRHFLGSLNKHFLQKYSSMPIFSIATVDSLVTPLDQTKQSTIKTKTLEDLAKNTQAMDKEHEYELNEYIENAAASRGNNSPQTPTITLIGKGVAVLVSVIIVILLTILALLIASIAIFWPIRSCTCDSAPSVSNVYPSTK